MMLKQVDFEHYRKVLSNKDVVAQGEKLLREFKPVEYDVSAQLKAIDAFQAKAVSFTVSGVFHGREIGFATVVSDEFWMRWM